MSVFHTLLAGNMVQEVELFGGAVGDGVGIGLGRDGGKDWVGGGGEADGVRATSATGVGLTVGAGCASEVFGNMARIRGAGVDPLEPARAASSKTGTFGEAGQATSPI